MSQEQRDDKKHGAYSPLTEHEIEVLREEMLADDGFLPEGKGRVARLCDMAVNSLFYAQEIQWLRAMPSAGVALSAAEMTRLMTAAGYDTSKAHPACYERFSYCVLLQLLNNAGVPSRREIPAEVFDGHAVFLEACSAAGPDPTLRSHHVSAVLDALARLVRKNAATDRTISKSTTEKS